MSDLTADEAIDIIERAAEQRHIASSNCADFEDPEPAREAVRNAFREANMLRATAEHYGRALGFAVCCARSGESVESMQDALARTAEE